MPQNDARQAADNRARHLTQAHRLGATGQYPYGKRRPDDEGELRTALALVGDRIEWHFGKSVTWLSLPIADARQLARMILALCDQDEGGPP